jgi:hypothetical protein
VKLEAAVPHREEVKAARHLKQPATVEETEDNLLKQPEMEEKTEDNHLKCQAVKLKTVAATHQEHLRLPEALRQQ